MFYIKVKNHNAYERDLEKFTRFIVYILEKACKKCFDDVIDNLCVVFDLDGFSYSNMDYQFTKNLIWLLSRHYPERLGTCLVLNSSYLFSSCWMMVKPWYSKISLSQLSKSCSHLVFVFVFLQAFGEDLFQSSFHFERSNQLLPRT